MFISLIKLFIMVLQLTSNHSAIQPKVNSLNSKILDDVEKWMVEREGFSSEVASKSRKEFLMFMSLAFMESESFIKDEAIIPSKDADEFWHYFLLFNNKYNQWCKSKFGSIINHFPGQAENNGWEKTKRGINALYGVHWEKSGSSSASFNEELCDPDRWF